MKKILVSLVFVLAISIHTMAGTAALRAYSRSLILYPTTAVRTGGGTYNLNWTTYDPKQNLPLFVPASGTNGAIIVSSELRQLTNSGVYSTIFSLWQNGFVVQDGLVNLAIPIRDTDKNRIRDLMQPELTFYTGTTGRVRGIWPTTNGMRIEARLSREAGSDIGGYSGYLVSSNTYYNFTGQLGIMHMEGTADYQRGSTNTIALSLVRTGKSGQQNTLYGETTYKATSNVIVLAAVRLYDDAGGSYVMRSSTLYRKGNRYVGDAGFVDGDLDTPWPDYKEWVLDLVDENDSDGNGVPDISDPSAVPDDRGPALTVTAPSGMVARVSTLPITLRGTASDRSGVDYVVYRIVNGVDSTDFLPAQGTTRWSIPISSLARGTNFFFIRASDTLGNLSPEVRRAIIYTGP